MGRYFLGQADASSEILGFGCNNFSSMVPVDLIFKKIWNPILKRSFQKWYNFILL